VSVEEMKAAIRDRDDAYMRNDADKLVSLFTEDGTITDPAGTLKGPEGIRLYLKWVYTHFSKVSLREVGVIVEGNRLAREVIFEGTMPDGLTVTYPVVSISEFKDGKTQSWRIYYDVLAPAKQTAKGWMARRALRSIEARFRRGLR